MEKSKFSIILFAGMALAFFSISAYAVPPKVTKTIPENGDQNVDPSLRTIRIEFDQNMNQGGMSVCGGGPSFPKTAGKPKWINKKTLVMRVKLQPNYEYELSINCQSYKNFKNTQGESAVVYPIKFKTTTAGEKTGMTTKSPNLLLQEGIYAEETEGDLEKAIGLYQQVLEQYKEVERLAARATYQLGMCHLKKGEKETAGDYFQEVVDYYPEQTRLVKKAQAQLDKIQPETKESVFEQIDYQVIRFLGEQFGETALEAGQQHLLVNSHVYYANHNGFLYKGGMNAFYNWTGRTITQKVRFGGTSYPDQTHYGVDGHELNTEIVPDKTRPNHWQIYWTPDEPLAPEEHLYYGWSLNDKRKLPQLPGDVYSLTMQNQYGSPAIETFFLILPKELKISQSNPPTGSQELLNFDVHWWTKTVQQGENHVEGIQLKIADVNMTVEESVKTISVCAEGDARVGAAMVNIKKLDESAVLIELKKYLTSEENTIRRSAIYVLWQSKFSDIAAAVAELEKLCSHEEDLTRGMAGLALGQNKALSSFTVLEKMTLDDPSGYARRCGAYALGLMGDARATPILEKALKDPDRLVQNNAEAALKMLELKSSEEKQKIDASVESAKTWLDLVDKYQYDESWEQAASFFKKAMPKKQWNISLKISRDPLGELISRELVSTVYATELPGAPDSEYVVITFKASYENKNVLEQVTPMLDNDGKWRVSGYYIM